MTALKLNEIDRNNKLKEPREEVEELSNQINGLATKKDFANGEIVLKVEAKNYTNTNIELSYLVGTNAIVSGTFLKPTVSTNLKSASADVANHLVQMQKDKLQNQGKDIIGGFLGKNKVSTDTTKVNEGTKTDPVKSVLKGLLKKKKNN